MDTRHFFATFTVAFATAAVLTGCTATEEDLTPATGKEEIQFNVRSMQMARELQSASQSSLPSSITLHAWHRRPDNNLTTKWTTAQMNNDGIWTYTGSNRYWPENGALDVVAFSSESGVFNDDAVKPALERFSVIDNNEDLTYAVAQAFKTNGNAIDLEFQSALCEVDFVTVAGEGNLVVEVNSITIGNVSTEATFLFPTGGEMTGSWTDHNEANAEMTVTPDENGNGALRMIPQCREAWRAGGGKNGTYLKVNCTVWSRCADGETLIPLYEGDTYMSVYADWRPGKRYIHVLDFSGGNIGYTSLYGDTPTLDKIKIQSSIDSYVAE